MITDHVAVPISRTDLECASRDPLSSPALLRRLYYDYKKQDGSSFRDYHLSNLARNPSLPSDIFVPLLVDLEDVEERFFSYPMSVEMLSSFFSNPLTTFEQVLGIVCNSANLRDLVGLEGLRSCKTVIEVFDRLVPLFGFRHKVFLSRLLCSPLISREDFRSRIVDYEVKLKLDNWIIYSSSRFVPNDADYRSALSSLTYGSDLDFYYGLGTIANENTSTEFLVEALGYAAGRESVETLIYENFSCPIELSAHFLLENIEDYGWRPSALLTLNLKANEYLTLTAGAGPWEDLPLSWKLRLIAG